MNQVPEGQIILGINGLWESTKIDVRLMAIGGKLGRV